MTNCVSPWYNDNLPAYLPCRSNGSPVSTKRTLRRARRWRAWRLENTNRVRRGRRRRSPPPTPSGSERPKRKFSPKNASFKGRGKEGEGRRKCSEERGGSRATIDRTAITALELCPWQPTNHCFINCSVAEGGPKVSVYYVLFCVSLLFCFCVCVGFFFGGGGGGGGTSLKHKMVVGWQRWVLEYIVFCFVYVYCY